MTTDDSIRDIPCPLDLKRNENIFIIGAKSIAELSRDLGLGAFHVYHFDLIMLRADAMRNPISRVR
jgi:hypothetical protein